MTFKGRHSNHRVYMSSPVEEIGRKIMKHRLKDPVLTRESELWWPKGVNTVSERFTSKVQGRCTHAAFHSTQKQVFEAFQTNLPLSGPTSESLVVVEADADLSKASAVAVKIP
jgi:hypothetical protein